MLIGYARVSTADQTLGLQQDALTTASCERVFTDTASGAKAERVGLAKAIAYAREGGVLVVWRLDRLGRSLKHLIETITALAERKVGFKSITENIDMGCVRVCSDIRLPLNEPRNEGEPSGRNG